MGHCGDGIAKRCRGMRGTRRLLRNIAEYLAETLRSRNAPRRNMGLLHISLLLKFRKLKPYRRSAQSQRETSSKCARTYRRSLAYKKIHKLFENMKLTVCHGIQ